MSRRQITPCAQVGRHVARPVSTRNCLVCTGVFVYATEFCCRNESHKFKFIWFYVTCDHLLRRQISSLHKSTYHSNVPPWLVTATLCPVRSSLRSKRFRLVSEQRETEERDFRFWPREKWNESAVFDSLPRSLFRDRTKTLATQAKCVPTITVVNCRGLKPVVYFVWFKPSEGRIGVYLIITLFQSQRAWLISPFPSCFLLKLLTKRDCWRKKRLPFAFGENQLLSCEILSFMNTAKRNDALDNLEQRILDILISR